MVGFLVTVWGWVPFGGHFCLFCKWHVSCLSELSSDWGEWKLSGHLSQSHCIWRVSVYCELHDARVWAGVERMINTYWFYTAFSWRVHGAEGQWCLVVLPESPHIQNFSDTCLQRVSSSSTVHWQHREPGSECKAFHHHLTIQGLGPLRCFHSSPEKHMITSSYTIRLWHDLLLLPK